MWLSDRGRTVHMPFYFDHVEINTTKHIRCQEHDINMIHQYKIVNAVFPTSKTWITYFQCNSYCIQSKPIVLLVHMLPSPKWRFLRNKASLYFQSTMKTEKAWFGMSWFWFPEAQFGCASGVVATRVGFTGNKVFNPEKKENYLSFKGGTTENATYRNIGDHTEAVEVKESIVSTETDQCSVGVWSVRDRFQKPTGHFLVGPWFNGACVFEACFFYVNHIFHVYCSTFRQYMSAIFCHGDEQMRLAQESLKAAQIDLKKEIQTVIQPAGPFYQAEEWVLGISSVLYVVFPSYHQKYILQKHGPLLTSLGLSRGPQLVASSLAARLNGYLGGYGSKVFAGFQNTSWHTIRHIHRRRVFWKKQRLWTSWTKMTLTMSPMR